MADGGYLPSQIDDFTMRDVDRVFKYWNRHPPASRILAAVYKVTPQLTLEEQEAEEKAEIARIKGMFRKDGNLVNLQDFARKHQAVATGTVKNGG